MFVVGPPGSNVRELTLHLSDHFETVVVSVGDLLKKEVSKKTEIGQKMKEYINNLLYVPDDLVIDVRLFSINRDWEWKIIDFEKTSGHIGPRKGYPDRGLPENDLPINGDAESRDPPGFILTSQLPERPLRGFCPSEVLGTGLHWNMVWHVRTRAV